MSLESYPGGELALQELARRCDEAAANEDWNAVKDPSEYYDFESFQLCEELRFEFERRYHLLNRREVLGERIDDDSQPLFVNELELTNGWLQIPNVVSLGSNHLTMDFQGRSVTTDYLDIHLAESTRLDEEGNEECFKGPHLIGVIGIDTTGIEIKGQPIKINGYYTFLAPFRFVHVSDEHHAGQFN